MTNHPSPINKVVYFVESYFNSRDYDRFGIQTFIDNGFEVEVWDFTPFLAADEYIREYPPAQFDCHNWILFNNRKKAFSAISLLTPSCFVISLIHYNPKTFYIHRLLSKKGILYCVSAMALPKAERSVYRRATNKLKAVLKPKIVMRKLFYSIPHEMAGIKPADFVLARGEKYGTSGMIVTDKSEVIWAHYYDYDIYLRERNKNCITDAKTGVFIDEYLPFHPDFAYSGYRVPATPDEYYPKLRRFFDYLEDEFGLKIVVAAHPRSRYEEHPDFFGGRPVLRDRTLELVRESGFIIMHTSTAINFAVLYKKPVIIITTDRYNEGLTEDPTPEWLAGFFGKKVHNLDYPIDFDIDKELYINEEAYKSYRNAYIKKDGTEDLQSWQILANRIKYIK
jgi:hypothetical protein